MTIEGFAFERLFCMPAFEGVKALRAQCKQSPDLPLADIVELIKNIELDVKGLDLEASVALIGILPPDLPADGAHFYRGCIRKVMLAYKPDWARTMLKGRSRFFATLERDEQSLFRQTGILDNPPEDEFVEWWDQLCGEVRLIGDAEKMERAREAEKLSFDMESERMMGEGINEPAIWVGLDDNTKGYDVQAYEFRDGNLVSKLIEVKSTIASPLRYRVTRNEWRKADQSGPTYVFHIWDMQKTPPALFLRTVEDVRPHIPTDNEDGQWKDVEVPLGGR